MIHQVKLLPVRDMLIIYCLHMYQVIVNFLQSCGLTHQRTREEQTTLQRHFIVNTTLSSMPRTQIYTFLMMLFGETSTSTEM